MSDIDENKDALVPAKAKPLSSGILMHRRSRTGLQVLLAHPGGPYFARKDDGAWTIPKGLVAADESPIDAARREFQEEVGWMPEGPLQLLGEVRLKSGKRVMGFALETTEDPAALLSRFSPGTFGMEWPPKSGRMAEFPEVDRIDFFSIDEARSKINPAQAPLIDRLLAIIS